MGIDTLLLEEESLGFARIERGRLVKGGRWYSPFETLAFKLPLGTLALLVASGGFWTMRIRRWNLADAVVLTPAIALLAFLCANAPMNWAVRHALPALPFLFIAVGPVVRLAWNHRLARVAVIGCLAWNVYNDWSVRPGPLSFGNEFAGGPSGAQRRFLGSNFDWGQDLFRLKDWADRRPEARPLVVSYFGVLGADKIGLKSDRLPATFHEGTSRQSSRGVFYWAVSSNLLNGLPGWIELDDGSEFLGTIHSPRLKPRAAIDRVGRTIFIFRVEPGPRGSSNLTFDDLTSCIAEPDRAAPTTSP